MRRIDLGKAIQILANLGVIAGIVFLAVELRQSNVLAKAQTRSEIAIAMSDHLNRLAEDADLAEIWVRAQSDFASLGPVEEQRVMNRGGALLRQWENVYYQYGNGLLDESEYLGELGAMRRNLNLPPMGTIFCRSRNAVSPEFRRVAEDLLEGAGCADAHGSTGQ